MNDFAVGDINSEEKGSGARANSGKVSFTLIPLQLLAGVARVFMGGKLKYAEWNWAKGMVWSAPMDCIFRHLIKFWWLVENDDADTGESHLDHVICNLLMLKHYISTFKEGDDRPSLELTHFGDTWSDFVKLFDEEDFLKRNPAIQEKLNAKQE